MLGSGPSAGLERARSPHLNFRADAPPHFILHAEDDDVVPVENALLLRAALKEKGVPVETHLFAIGGHGFGLRKAIGKPAEKWPETYVEWAKSHGV